MKTEPTFPRKFFIETNLGPRQTSERYAGARSAEFKDFFHCLYNGTITQMKK